MANVAADDKKIAGPEFGNAMEVYRVKYDAAVDDLTTANDVELLGASGDIVIHACYIKGITDFDSAGDSVAIDVGIDGGDEDILFDGVAQASLVADALIQPTIVEGTPNVMPMPLKLASGGVIIMKKLSEAVTAGKCEFMFLVSKY
jgi:hypothetical protein